jgi:hypothetical protein
MEALVCYAAPCRCPGCGQHIPGGVEHVPVPRGRDDLEWTTEQLVVHGVDGPALFERARVAFVKIVPRRSSR